MQGISNDHLASGREGIAPPSGKEWLTAAQKKKMFITIAFLGVCAITIVAILALPQINRLRWQVALGVGLGISATLGFAALIFCKTPAVPAVPVKVPVAPKPPAEGKGEVSPIAPAERAIDLVALGEYARTDFTTGKDCGGLKEIAATAVEIFLDAGQVRQNFPKKDVSKYQNAYAALQTLPEFPKQMGAALLKLTDQELGSILLMMEQLETHDGRKPSADLYLQGFDRHRLQCDATLAPSGYPAQLVEALTRNGYKAEELTIHDIGEVDSKIYIDLATLQDSAVEFVTHDGRKGIAFAIETKPSSGWIQHEPRKGVLAIYQRFPNSRKWVCTISGDLPRPEPSDKQRSILSLSHHGFAFGSDEDYALLSQLLAGKDPECRLIKILEVGS